MISSLPSWSPELSQPLSHQHRYCIYYVCQFAALSVNVSALGLVWFLTVCYPTAVLVAISVPQMTRGRVSGDLTQAPLLKMELPLPEPPFMVAFSSCSGPQCLPILSGRKSPLV